jgi:hypothetical protein
VKTLAFYTLLLHVWFPVMNAGAAESESEPLLQMSEQEEQKAQGQKAQKQKAQKQEVQKQEVQDQKVLDPELLEQISQQQPYFQALVNIDLGKEQIESFMSLVHEYSAKYSRVEYKESRKNQADLTGRIKRAFRKLDKKLIREMGSILNDDQLDRFPAFHKELKKLLKRQSAPSARIDIEQRFPVVSGDGIH